MMAYDCGSDQVRLVGRNGGAKRDEVVRDDGPTRPRRDLLVQGRRFPS